ncbi:helix-turn-helix transcriptional regulator [Enterocloster citroniae]|jgi:putative transcriptional regulator|uniref:helix-turn-helix domain-containing protein n=1 Tax=Enterocloster citroniae TaxID=358743 RepID=UPI001D06687B|nr:helix-turn-helix transcriptional regulator [Enterocloster citroniae]MCB7067665.1 helix-turn-helix transcriptional regulator [Enterocloster citroniae]
MIKYDKLWETMKDKGITQYMLVKEYNISKSLLHRLRNNQGVNMNTIDTLCDILDCDIEDIATHYNSEE